MKPVALPKGGPGGLATSAVRALAPYVIGKPISELARELGIPEERIVKLASNENPLGPQSAGAGRDARGAGGHMAVSGWQWP